MNNPIQHVGVIGAGAWGTALASVVQRAGRSVHLWMREPQAAAAINALHENRHYLPGIALDPSIRATASMATLAECDAFLLVAPAQHTRELAKLLAGVLKGKPVPVVICAKGIEQGTSKLLSEIVNEELPASPVAVLSGPSFAIEVARDLPTALTFATRDADLGKNLIQAMSTPHFRLYQSSDVVGAQLGGAVKNVLAVACGIAAGYKMGDNSRAALITRGLAEMIRLGTAMNAKSETLTGLSGIGDLVLTCSSLQSRNMSLGAALGNGVELDKILAGREGVTEGVYTAAAAQSLAEKYKVEMPIVKAVDAILNRGARLPETIAALLARPLRQE
jgi:glycerol-3-phosphate dehydrogenase (NAD(P)+)